MSEDSVKFRGREFHWRLHLVLPIFGVMGSVWICSIISVPLPPCSGRLPSHYHRHCRVGFKVYPGSRYQGRPSRCSLPELVKVWYAFISSVLSRHCLLTSDF
ncbi:hypothetical protein K469DRAFT_376706 [Zopfia rhizophila CBS 207.26]|uniref:Uncharacterized protein n=1 Tax=Zopfia rhizophila CBS 207.26 TaxID=1314779 RepID=A0A6A6DHH0_9PEZI|nr:hypothetical protein K469DRAFT_376706 [Zopfia rhizophila CBS 207.26]